MESLPSRARLPKSAIFFSMPAIERSVRVAHHRHHEALLGADRDADVVVVLVDEILPVDLGIDRRNVLQRLDHRLGEEAHEAELRAVLLLEHVLVLAAQVHHRAHVHVVERGQHGGGVLGVLQAARDGLAQLRHLHALFARRHRPERRARAPGRGPPARGAGAPPVAMAASMSPLVTRPSLPEPATLAGLDAAFGGEAGRRPGRCPWPQPGAADAGAGAAVGAGAGAAGLGSLRLAALGSGEPQPRRPR